ncbi:MAG: glycosyltransferase family 4 protein [Candidatus Omnitrophica bacterium]|nr:glycosyltransferase family 4 protein [Candidatus Omnitrophota bacterium]
MRICHVITKPELGGAQTSTLNLLSRLPRDKYTVSVITSPSGILKTDFEKIQKIRFFSTPFLVRPINPISDILAFMHIFIIYIVWGPSLVHTHSSKAGIIGRWAAVLYNLTRRLCKVKSVRCEVIHTVHGWSFNDYQPLALKRFLIFMEKITANFTTKIICVSNSDIETGLRYRIAVRDKFTVIKYGIPFADFSEALVDKSRKRRELGITNDGPIVGMIACLKPQKAPQDYIKACIRIHEKMPDINFLLIGDGVLRKKCSRLLVSSSLNGRFIFSGWRRDVPEILSVLDIVVLTSKWEGMPIAVIEALLKGCPVVATDTGGTKELVKDGVTGYLVHPGSYEDVAQKVLSILSDPDILARMKKEAFLSIDRSFELNRMVAEVENLYKAVL